MLETILYDTFIMISVYFKEQVFAVTQKLWDAKMHTWKSDSGEIEGFFEMLKAMYQSE